MGELFLLTVLMSAVTLYNILLMSTLRSKTYKLIALEDRLTELLLRIRLSSVKRRRK